MRISGRSGGVVIGVLAALGGVGLASRVLAADTCGDANRTGTVTVTDGVLVLSAAAQLPALCPRERCDMNVDGDVSVTDGVLALRVAAGIQTTVACSARQAGVIFGQILKSIGVGGAAHRRAALAARGPRRRAPAAAPSRTTARC